MAKPAEAKSAEAEAEEDPPAEINRASVDRGNAKAVRVPRPDPKAHFFKHGPMETTVDGEGEGPYQFTATWHKGKIEPWTQMLAPYKGRPGLNYLEVGVYEGRSLIWAIENILTDPTSKATAIDIFMEEYEARFDHNVAASGAADRITKIKEPSQTALRRMPLDSFDIIYIDGSHTADDVMADAILSWDLLEVGGMMIFDDYGWTGRSQRGALPPELLPKTAIDAFVTAHRYELELVGRGWQLSLRKLENPCTPKDYCSLIGQYQYFWRAQELRDADGRVIELSPEELNLVERLGKSRRNGQIPIRVAPAVRNQELYQQLEERLALDLRPRTAFPEPPPDSPR